MNKLLTKEVEVNGEWYTVEYYPPTSLNSYPEVQFVYDEDNEELPDSTLRDDIIAAAFED